jgi:hypothetical protein
MMAACLKIRLQGPPVTMVSYIFRRPSMPFPMLLDVSATAFLVLHLIPGDPARMAARAVWRPSSTSGERRRRLVCSRPGTARPSVAHQVGRAMALVERGVHIVGVSDPVTSSRPKREQGGQFCENVRY